MSVDFNDYLRKLVPFQLESGHSSNAKEWFTNYILQNNYLANKVIFTATNTINVDIEDSFVESLMSMSPYPLAVSSRDYEDYGLTFIFSDKETGCIYVNLSQKEKTCYYSHVSNNEGNVKKFDELLREKSLKGKNKNNVYVISSNSRGLSLHSMGELDATLEANNYAADVVEAYDYILSEFQKKDPYGRLAIVNGPPGTGKSYMLRSLLSSIKDSLIILLPTKMVGDIDSPGIIKLLSEERYYGELEDVGKEKLKNMPIIFVLEDADSCLVPRDDGNMSLISSFLNYTDGIFGSMLDMRIIATTNADRIQFDSALLRPGRLCKHVRVGYLSKEQASIVYNRLTGKEKVYDNEVSLAEVYGDAYNKKQEKVKKPKSLGFNT
jgi:hypothetical protein